MGYSIVKSAHVTDPIMAKCFGNLLLSVTVLDLLNQTVGLFFAICYEFKWMLRLFMLLTITFLVIRCTTVLTEPVVKVKSAPLLGRSWTPSNTPYDQMENDIKMYHVRLPSQVAISSLYTFEKTLHCCGVNGPKDYLLTKSSACYYGGPPPSIPGSNITDVLPNPFGNHSMVPLPNNEFRLQLVATPDGKHNDHSSETDRQGALEPERRSILDGGAKYYTDACKPKVSSVWEGARATFDATVTAIFWTILTALLTIAWCEFWGDGLLTGLTCCADK